MPDTRRDDQQLPPIPDGGLSSSMPEWLRRPPAWRTLADEDVVQPEPTRTGALPEADTSVIDPRTFLTDDDLPTWLRTMHRPQPASTESETADDDRRILDEPDIDGHDNRSQRAPSRFVPRQPVAMPSAPEQGSARRPDQPPQRNPQAQQPAEPRGSWWQGPQLAVALSVALLIAIAVIVALLI